MAGFNLFETGSLVRQKPYSSDEALCRLIAMGEAISGAAMLSEQEAAQRLLAIASPSNASDPQIFQSARQLVAALRSQRKRGAGVDALMQGFPLSSKEGLALMGLAEALLRVPDTGTADLLIADKLGQGDWQSHARHSASPWVKGVAYGFALASRLVGGLESGSASSFSAPVVRHAAKTAMRQLGEQFVCGQTIEGALRNSKAKEAQGYRYSYDMLGEAALTSDDAQRYYQAYESALHAIGREGRGRGIHDSPGISVKLSALHPRYHHWQRERVMQELLPRLKQLLLIAKSYGVGLNIDAEESERLELSLSLIEALAFDPELHGYEGMGVVVQAYQKRCLPLIDYLVELAHVSKRRFMVRLVKGAYWDSEIKRAQVEGWPAYPVYTRKAHTDMSYLVSAQKLLAAHEVLYPQFATHNAHTVSTLIHWANQRKITRYEFQCLYGMGEALYDQVVGSNKLNIPCRIYAPVGPHSTLLAYLVRRLLENGANSSFVNQLLDERIPLDQLLADPFVTAGASHGEPHPAISLPATMFGEERENSRGLDLSNNEVMASLHEELRKYGAMQWQAAPLVVAGAAQVSSRVVFNPADHRDVVGEVSEADESTVEQALSIAESFAKEWQEFPVQDRAACLRKAADLFEAHRGELYALAIREAGKTLTNAIGEVREAVDFLRYYAAQAEGLPIAEALGPVACISPWNFPLAIFTGEVSAALAAGNVVLAKPAEQTPLIAYRAVQLMHEAGIPKMALQFLPGPGELVGEKLVRDSRVRGVVFTGSTDVARRIHQLLAQRAAVEGRDIPLIAETGGQNAMIVDASALPEQVVQDVLISAFDSAGQRCSALRVLCLQEEIADHLMEMIRGAMRELSLGNPAHLSTDIGPVIDAEALSNLQEHVENLRAHGNKVFQLPLQADHANGTFIAPALIEFDSMSQLKREVFGPILHVLRYRAEELPQLLDAINASGYGLTMGVQSRIGKTIDVVKSRVKAGNLYVNRNMVGAVVGVQPFGGEGLSGTGPKAGGPLYLHRLLKDSVQVRIPGLDSPEPIANDAYTDFIEYCEPYPVLLDAAYAYKDLTLFGKQLELPGPTGERNVLHFVPRGRVWCAAASPGVLMHQMLAVLACGSAIVMTEGCAAMLPRDLPPSVREKMFVSPEPANEHVDAVLIESSLAPALRLQMAEKEGTLVPVMEVDGYRLIPLWRLFNERTVCINTTAAGGNASLVTLAQ